MATIVLIVEESESKLISGFPEYIDFSTNNPSTVFYTLDGSTPTDSSLMAAGNSSMTMADRVYIPTNGKSFTLKAKAVTSDGSSEIYEKDFYTDSTNLDSARHIGEEGISVLRAGSSAVSSLSKGLDGEKKQESSATFDKLEMKASTEDSKGVKTRGGTSLSFVNILENVSSENEGSLGKSSTPNNNNNNFDPKAGMIIIDGRTQSDLDSQSVRLVNRPAGSMDNVSKFYNENLQQQQAPATANLVRYIYNPNTGVTAFYYFESKECRWIISKQKVDYKQLNISSTGRARSAAGIVFRWIQERSVSTVF